MSAGVSMAIGTLICLGAILGFPVTQVGSAILVIALMVGGFGLMFTDARRMKPFFWGCLGFALEIALLPPWARWAWARVVELASPTITTAATTTSTTASITSSPATRSLHVIPWSSIIHWSVLALVVLFALLVVGRLALSYINHRLERWWRRERVPELPRVRERAEPPDPPPEKLPEPERREEIGI